MLCIVFVLVGSLLVLPVLSYTASVIRTSGTQRHKSTNAEIARGALRAALADVPGLYTACSDSGLHTPVQLADPGLSVPVDLECTTMKSTQELDDTELRIAMTVTQLGATVPLGTVGTPYTASTTDPTAWISSVTNTSTGGSIFLPLLPTHALNHPATGGYMMPSWAGNCRVFFPGTYNDPVTISDSTPTYFASGIYYFESAVTFSGPVDVVIGQGAIPGCVETDQDAAFNAINAPFTPNISGLGATFIFGRQGRLVVTDNGGTQGPSVQFNSRLVDPTDVGSTVSAGVSIVSVNGTYTGSASAPLDIPGRLAVPNSFTEANPADSTPPTDAVTGGYFPSTLVPTVSPDPPALSIVDISLLGTGTALVYVPGYTAVPQGTVSITVAPGASGGKSVQLIGAVLAATVAQSADLPADNQLGMVNRIVQKTFKIVATTLSDENTNVTSVALVQVNDYGEYAINSWVTVQGDTA